MNLNRKEMIEIARKRANLTQQEVADRLGIHLTQYHRRVLNNFDAITYIEAVELQKCLPVKLTVENKKVKVELI